MLFKLICFVFKSNGTITIDRILTSQSFLTNKLESYFATRDVEMISKCKEICTNVIVLFKKSSCL